MSSRVALSNLQPSTKDAHQLVGGSPARNRQRQSLKSRAPIASTATLLPPIDENNVVAHVVNAKLLQNDDLVKVGCEKKCTHVGTNTVPTPNTRATSVNTEVSIEPVAPQNGEHEVKEMMLSAQPNAEYWRALAEQRALALSDALKENLALCQELAGLRERNRLLQALADQGQEYAEILKQALEEGNEGEGD